MNRGKTDKVRNICKEIAHLATPLLLFAVLALPYGWFNRRFVVDWFGCGCPVMDEYEHMVGSAFNANDFTACFWAFVSLLATVLAVFLSRRIPRDRPWGRVAYVAAVLAASMGISLLLCRQMMWD